MSKVELLIATMHQSDLSKYREMNIQTDAVFANQADRYEYFEENIDGCNIKMITTCQRGVGKNRNQALLYSSAELCLLGDDDVFYIDGYEKGVIEAFNELTNADIIVFNADVLNGNRKETRQIKKIKRIRLYNFMRYGTYNIAFRRKSWLRSNIWFTTLFGGGANYSCGEDSLFLREALKKGLKIYSYPYKIAVVKHETSTWFKGFNHKYFFDLGAWLSAAFPIVKYFGAVYYMFKLRKRSQLGCSGIIQLMFYGMIAFRKGVSYEEWENETADSK